LNSQLPTILGSEIHIDGPGADRLTIVAPLNSPVFVVGNTTSGAVFISGMTIQDGKSAAGGCIEKGNTGRLELREVLIFNCTSTGSLGGGAIRVEAGVVIVDRSTVMLNSATVGTGGGISVLPSAFALVMNSTVYANVAQNGGGGISNQGALNVTNSTIGSNSAGGAGAGGILSAGTSPNVKSTIIAVNRDTNTQAFPDVKGNFHSFGFNLIEKSNGSTGFTLPTDIVGSEAAPVDPGFLSLSSVGGGTPTLPINLNSPAIDKGTNDSFNGILNTDQRGAGFARVRDNPLISNPSGGGGADIGAYERHTYSTFDFEGDGRSDIGIFRPAGGEWWIYPSQSGSTRALQFGASADRIAPADFTGDGITDIAFWRPSDGNWYVLRSENFSFFAFGFGTNGDVPAPGDFDGDRKADAGIFRPSTGKWFELRSTGGVYVEQFGANGDVPVVSDYDGDGRADIAIYRPSVGQWWLNRSTAGVVAFSFGVASDKPVPGDFTGDNKADVAFWRPSNGNWVILRSEDSTLFGFAFGVNGDIPAPGDYDGDGKFDATVFRPSTATWFSQRSLGGFAIQQFGLNGDRPIPSAFVP
jgi:hypothetical protein